MFLISAYLYRNDIKGLINLVKIYVVGEANFVTNKLSEQIADNNFNIYDGKKVVETSILPIQLRKLSIAKSFSFANEGSSLITHKDKLFVADRLGNIFLFAENKFK